jgi:3-hydroxyacyl-CoA dehydrogenase/enoyl-CoA hydratase/3-hydroxybutyryl-CoA epimerase
LYGAYGSRMKPAITLDRMYKQKKLLGKKNKKGFYINEKPNMDILDATVHHIVLQDVDILDRTMLIMINESARILEEGHIKNPHYLDMCMIMGAGFPAFRGGILKYADSLGIDNVYGKLKQMEVKYGERFTPCELIKKLSSEKTTFYGIYTL